MIIVKKYTQLLNFFIGVKYSVFDFAIWYFVLGMGYIHLRAVFLPYEQSIWDHIYYTWEGGLFCLLLLLVRCFIDKEYRASTNPLILYCLIRFLWILTSPVLRIWVNHPAMVTALFTVLLIGAVILLWIDRKQRQRER